MKAELKVNSKSGDIMAPTPTIVEPSHDQKKSVTGKHVLIAVTVLLCVAVVVAGFVVGLFFLKQTSDRASDNMTKVFHMKVHEGKKVINEDIKTNIEDGTTEVNTDEDGKKHTIFSDYNKGLMLLAEHGPGSKCFLAPLNVSDSDGEPEVVENYMRTHPNPDFDVSKKKNKNVYMTVSPNPIRDTSFLGTKINEICEGKDIYWMYPKEGQSEGTPSRQKRAPEVYAGYCLICHTHYPCGCRHCYWVPCIIVISKTASA